MTDKNMIGAAFCISEALIDRAGRAASDRDTEGLNAIVPQIASSLDLFRALVGDPSQLSSCERAEISHQSSIIIAKAKTVVQLISDNISTASDELNDVT